MSSVLDHRSSFTDTTRSIHYNRVSIVRSAAEPWHEVQAAGSWLATRLLAFHISTEGGGARVIGVKARRYSGILMPRLQFLHRPQLRPVTQASTELLSRWRSNSPYDFSRRAVIIILQSAKRTERGVPEVGCVLRRSRSPALRYAHLGPARKNMVHRTVDCACAFHRLEAHD